MIFDLNKRYVTRSGLEVTHIRASGGIYALIDDKWRSLNDRGVSLFDSDLDIMTEGQHRAKQVDPTWDKLEPHDQRIVRAMMKDQQRMGAVRHVREKTHCPLGVAVLVANASLNRG